MAVYFAEAGGYIKIGFSVNPVSRVSTITRNGTRPADIPYGVEADLIGWVPGQQWTEGAWHSRYVDHRVVGEWFQGIDRDEIRQLIWANPRGVDAHRMSALAVWTCAANPDLTRDEVAALGIPVEGEQHPEQIKFFPV